MAKNQKSHARKRLEVIGEFTLAGLVLGWMLNAFLLRGLLEVFYVSTTLAVVIGGVLGFVWSVLPKGDPNDPDAH